MYQQVQPGERVNRTADPRRGYPVGTVVRSWVDPVTDEPWAHVIFDRKRDGGQYLKPDAGVIVRVRKLESPRYCECEQDEGYGRDSDGERYCARCGRRV